MASLRRYMYVLHKRSVFERIVFDKFYDVVVKSSISMQLSVWLLCRQQVLGDHCLWLEDSGYSGTSRGLGLAYVKF